MGGVNLVAGFRPELWRDVMPDDTPPVSRASTRTSSARTASRCRRRSTTPCSGSPAAPTTSSSTSRARRSPRCAGLAASRGDVELAVPARPRPDGLHRRDREPVPDRRARARARPRRRAGRRRHLLLLQKWAHDAAAWESLPVARAGARDRAHEARQRRARRQAGRLARRAHRPGRLRRRSSAATCPTARSPTTARCSSASARTQTPLAAMLDSMAGRDDGTARRADAIHGAAERRVLLRSVGRGADSSGRDGTRLTHADGRRLAHGGDVRRAGARSLPPRGPGRRTRACRRCTRRSPRCAARRG